MDAGSLQRRTSITTSSGLITLYIGIAVGKAITEVQRHCVCPSRLRDLPGVSGRSAQITLGALESVLMRRDEAQEVSARRPSGNVRIYAERAYDRMMALTATEMARPHSNGNANTGMPTATRLPIHSDTISHCDRRTGVVAMLQVTVQ